MNIDKYGMIQSGGDGGDTCHRMFTMYLRMLLVFKIAIENKGFQLPKIINDPSFELVRSASQTEVLLQPKPGIYTRHCDPNFWGSDPRNTSRDQLVPVICYLSFLASRSGDLGKEYQYKLAALLKACLKRGMFAQNIYPNWEDPRTQEVKKKLPDFLNFDLWGMFARGFVNTWYFPIAIPFILFGDLFLVLSVLFTLFAPINQDATLKFRMPGPTDVDDDNINNVLMVSQHVYQTPLSWLARKIYKRFRKPNLGNSNLGERSPILGALMWYHRAPEGNQELAELARTIVEQY